MLTKRDIFMLFLLSVLLFYFLFLLVSDDLQLLVLPSVFFHDAKVQPFFQEKSLFQPYFSPKLPTIVPPSYITSTCSHRTSVRKHNTISPQTAHEVGSGKVRCTFSMNYGIQQATERVQNSRLGSTEQRHAPTPLCDGIVDQPILQSARSGVMELRKQRDLDGAGTPTQRPRDMHSEQRFALLAGKA